MKGRHTAALCLFTGVASSAAWAYHHAFLKPDDRGRARFGGRVITTKDLDSALGASGMVMGVGAVAACLAPTLPVQLMFIPIPMPLILLVASYAAVDSYFVNSTTSRIGHSAHLGGGVAGVAYYLLFLTRLGGVSSILRRGIR